MTSKIEAIRPKIRRPIQSVGIATPLTRPAKKIAAGTAVPQDPGAGRRNRAPPPETIQRGQRLAGIGKLATRSASCWLERWPIDRSFVRKKESKWRAGSLKAVLRAG